MKYLETVLTFMVKIAGFFFSAKWKRRDTCPYRDCPLEPPEEDDLE